MARFMALRSYSARTELILLSLTYNPLTVSLSSAQLLNVKRWSKRSSRYRFLIFGMTQLRIKSSLPCFAANALTTSPRNLLQTTSGASLLVFKGVLNPNFRLCSFK